MHGCNFNNNYYFFTVSALIFSVTPAYGQFPFGPEQITNECISAAICNLIRGDLYRESQGFEKDYYNTSVDLLRKSIDYQKCSLDSILTVRRRHNIKLTLMN